MVAKLKSVEVLPFNDFIEQEISFWRDAGIDYNTIEGYCFNRNITRRDWAVVFYFDNRTLKEISIPKEFIEQCKSFDPSFSHAFSSITKDAFVTNNPDRAHLFRLLYV